MADLKGTPGGLPGQTIRRYHDENDGTYSESAASHMRYWDTGTLAWERVSGTGGAITTSGGAGGGAATIADGADVAQGTTTDAASASTVVGLLKNIKAALAGALTTNATLSAETTKVIGTVNQGTSPWVVGSHAVTNAGTFATQSKLIDTGGVNVASISAAGRLSVDASGVAVPVTDNAGSLTVDAPVGTPAFVRLSDGAAVLVGQKAMASSLPVVLSSDQASVPVAATLAAETTKVIGTVNPPALTKGTQGANGWSVQDLKDSGRVTIMWTAEFAYAQTAETLLTLTESRDGAATTTFSSKAVTSGKRLRLTSVALTSETLGTGTTIPQRAYLRCRFNTGGAATTGSALQGVWGVAAEPPAILKTMSEGGYWAFPDGVEFLGDGTKQIGFSLETPDWVTTTGTGRAKVTISAFEY